MSYDGGRKKKESDDPVVRKIIAMRDSLSADEKQKEAAHEACKGMYKCSKLADKKCLDGIVKKLEALGAKKPAAGGGKKKRSRSRSKSKTRARSRSRSKSRK